MPHARDAGVTRKRAGMIAAPGGQFGGLSGAITMVVQRLAGWVQGAAPVLPGWFELRGYAAPCLDLADDPVLKVRALALPLERADDACGQWRRLRRMVRMHGCAGR